MIHDFIDMDTQKKIRYVSESSNASTSGYSTMSPGPGAAFGNHSPMSNAFSMPSSPAPAQSPGTMLQAEFSNLNLPSNTQQQQHHSPHYAVLQAPSSNTNYMNFAGKYPSAQFGMHPQTLQVEFTAQLRILEQPVEKFRFRYKSEMHGTHGSLNGANSKRTPKTFPMVELANFNGTAVVRCSLFQTNIDSPHSHMLVVRKDDTDICDPHDLYVSQEQGYVANFQNMGIIHTAKKFILDELLSKKTKRLLFESGREELSSRQLQELRKEAEKEAKDMNLNQVRLCFEAFKEEKDKTWTRIAAPVYTNSINNRKSAQTGELRICRLSIATGSVAGGDDLILLVEKVSKKNIKVRFYELDEDEGCVWEAYGTFRESDVHHQYAIVCQTPAYRDKDIDKPVEVCIELVRPSDDERSDPPVTFRYKPRDSIASRKRRRTSSSATSSSTGSDSVMNSIELPKTVQEQTHNLATGIQMEMLPPAVVGFGNDIKTISEEFSKERQLEFLMNNEAFNDYLNSNTEELMRLCPQNSTEMLVNDLLASTQGGMLQMDGGSSPATSTQAVGGAKKKTVVVAANLSGHQNLLKIFRIYEGTRATESVTGPQYHNAQKQVADIFVELNNNGETLLHELIAKDDAKDGIKLCQVLAVFKLNHLLSSALNVNGQSALHYACLHDCAHYIRPLLRLGCDPNIQDQNGNTALHIAVQEQHLKCIDSYLNMVNVRFNLNIRNDMGLTALHLAVRLGYEMTAKLVKLDKSAVFVRSTKDGNNALHMAILQQDLKLTKLLASTQHWDNILSATNAAGHSAIALAKTLNTQEGKKIYEYLTSLCPATGSSNITAAVAIKEEESSSSSADEDDDDKDNANANAKPSEMLKIVKAERSDDGNDEINKDPLSAELSNAETKNLESILFDVTKFRKLSNLLEDADKWRTLAERAKMHHLICVWTCAEDMLRYIKYRANSIEYRVFAAVLVAEIGKDKLQQLQTN